MSYFSPITDALLADLQSTTTSQSNQYQRPTGNQYQHDLRNRSETPPPLPPPPPQEVLDSIPPPRQFDEVIREILHHVGVCTQPNVLQ